MKSQSPKRIRLSWGSKYTEEYILVQENMSAVLTITDYQVINRLLLKHSISYSQSIVFLLFFILFVLL